MKKKWSFIINSNYNNYLRNLVLDLSSEEFYFYSEGSDEDANLTYYFSSIHLNHIEKPEEVIENGLQIKSIFDGLSFLIHEDKNEFHQLKLGNLICNETNEVYCVDQTQPQYPFNVDFSLNPSFSSRFAQEIEKVISLSITENFLLNTFLILSEGISFRSAYQALDECNHHLKSKSMKVETLGFSKAQIKRFTYTANSFAAIGKDARHGSDKHPPPSKPLSLSEAQTLISEIIYEVIKKSYSIDLPIIKSYKIDTNDWFNSEF